MARPLRIEYPGAVYHITSRGNEKKAVFLDDNDRELFLGILTQVNKRYHWLCHAFCLMNNHYHLLIETPEGNLSLGMRQLNGVYTQAFNKRHKRTGHLFQGRYKAILIQKESHLLAVCRYVVLNPVRANIVESPEKWKWSSYRATAGQEMAPSCLTKGWILDQFNKKRTKAERAYFLFITSGVDQETIWKEIRGQAVLGEEEFVASLADYLKRKRDIPEIPKSQRFADSPSLDKLFSESTLNNRKKRNKKIVEAVEKYGYTQRAIADRLGFHFTYVSRILNQQVKR